jgi:hypothetical protein
MGDTDLGKTTFAGLIEYPLPIKSGVKDYVFYFVPDTDGYGQGARYFFDAFYPNHVKKNATSLEALVDALQSDVSQNGVQLIREIVIVAHGNSQALLFPVVNGTSSSNLPEFQYLTALSLAQLQRDIVAGKFADLSTKRKAILTHLQDNSWVTIRACNFGNNSDGMYAAYSFFGGEPNVYAPKLYQFFGRQPIASGMRFETRLKVHQHLVKQRFFRKGIHAPQRKEAVVQALADPAQFSQRFALGSVRVDNPLAADSATYEALIDSLNARTIPDSIQATFQVQNFQLTDLAKVVVAAKDSQWIIQDTFTYTDVTYKGSNPANSQVEVDYQIYEEVALSASSVQMTTLWSQARLKLVSSSEYFPFQLFLYSSENDLYHGKLFTLAAYLVDAPDAASKTRFDSIQSVLDSNSWSNSSTDLKALFKDGHNIVLTDNAVKTAQPPVGTGVLTKFAWNISDGDQYIVKLEHPSTIDGRLSSTLSVYSDPGSAATLQLQYESLAYIGTDADSPGTEVAASLDLLAIQDLVALIDYLRAPFKPGNSFYIFQAQEALRRKKGFREWEIANEPIDPNAVLSSVPSHYELSLSENADKAETVYQCVFDDVWSEVKSSDPSSTVFQSDLFTEEDLGKTLDISDDEINNRVAAGITDPDSPYTNIDELRSIQKAGYERFFATTEKSTFEPPTDAISCADFKASIAKWQEVQSQEIGAIQAALQAEKTEGGQTYLDVIQGLGSKYSFLKNMVKLTELAKLPTIPTTTKDVAKMIFKSEWLKENLPRIASNVALNVLVEYEFVVTIPAKMWLHFLEEQEKAGDAWEIVGRLTAVRQWLRALDHLAITNQGPFPDQLDIDISTPSTEDNIPIEPYYVSRYFQEEVDEGRYYNPILTSPDRIQAGFDDAVTQMNQLGKDLLATADDALSHVLQELDLDTCKTQVLIDAGILDQDKLKAMMLSAIAEALLDKLPEVP